MPDGTDGVRDEVNRFARVTADNVVVEGLNLRFSGDFRADTVAVSIQIDEG